MMKPISVLWMKFRFQLVKHKDQESAFTKIKLLSLLKEQKSVTLSIIQQPIFNYIFKIQYFGY